MTNRIATGRGCNRARLLLAACLVAWLCPALAQGFVYQVSRDGSPDSYLIGTMHSEDPRVTAQLARFAPLVEQADLVVIEMLPDAVTLMAIGAATLLPLDQRLQQVIGEQRFDALRAAAAELGIPIDLLDRLKPWAAAVTLGMPATRSGRFLDMEIYLHALAHGRPTAGMESAAEQLAVFEDMGADVEIALLDEMIKNARSLPTQLETLTGAFLSGDLQRLDQVARSQYDDMPVAVMRWFDERLLDQRNRRMLDRLPGLLAGQSAVVAVGALHLGGETGLVAGLRRLGYDVSRWSG